MADNVLMQVVNGFGKQSRRVLAAAAWTMFGSDQKHFVHADVEGIGLKSICQLVNQITDNLIYFRVLRTPTATINVLVIWKAPWGFIEFGMTFQQSQGGLTPGLMAQAIDLRDQADALAVSDLCQLVGPRFRDDGTPTHFRVRLEFEIVIDFQHHDVHAVLNKLWKCVGQVINLPFVSSH